MKYVVLIPDGCADWPVASLGGKTPLQAAHITNLDALAASGIIGTSANVPEKMLPGSDVATLSVLGYDPRSWYTGRAPLEALAQGIHLSECDWAVRCNLVTLENGILKSSTADHITTQEAAELLADAQSELEKIAPGTMRLHTSVSYRNLLVRKATADEPAPFSPDTSKTLTTAPHDLIGKAYEPALPKGPGANELRLLIDESEKVFADHPVNLARIARGKLPATHLWPWGQGQKPHMPAFAELYGIRKGAMITAVDLLRGIAVLLDWDRIEVPGITGYIDTDYAAKGRYGAAALEDYDIVCVHVEAPDEAGHEGDAGKKVLSMEKIDAELLPPLLDGLRKYDNWRILVSPDHPTPVAIKTHSRDAVPWLMAGTGIEPGVHTRYDEKTAAESEYRYDNGNELMRDFLRCPI